MDRALIERVRRFNRAITQRVGALDDHYLARDRPLGEARLLWEIGAEGCDLRVLRARLDLDSGYLSRLLRSLERDGLVVLEPSKRDRRVRTARLTRAGAAERAVVDRRSDGLAASLLEPLDAAGRTRLVTAMGEVEKLLTSALLRFAVVDPESPEAQHCLREYFAEIDRRFDAGFDPARSLAATALRPPRGLFLVASLRGEPIACGGLVFHGSSQPPEIKRMWVAASARGLGIGRRLLAELEARAAQRGGRAIRLETNRALGEAIAMYRTAGYVEVAPYNDEPYAHHWFEKPLAPRPGPSSGRRGRRPAARRP